MKIFDAALAQPDLNLEQAQQLAQLFAQRRDLGRLETTIRKVATLLPTQPEPRYDVAAIEAITARPSNALADLKLALDLNAKRLAQNPSAPNLLNNLRTDPRFASITNLPEYRQLVAPK